MALVVGRSMGQIGEDSVLGKCEKKKKRPPERKCGDWCEFLSSKGAIYYYNIKQRHTQWKKPDTWDDTSAYEPKAKKKARIEEAEETRRILGDAIPTTVNVGPAESTLPVKKRASSVLEVYKRKKLELDATKKTASEIDAKFSIERLREEQKNRRDLLKKELQTHTQKEEPCVIQGMIKFVNNEALDSEVRELVFDKAEMRSNRLKKDFSKIEREIQSKCAAITRLKRKSKLLATHSATLTQRNLALAERETQVLHQVTGKISTYNSLK